jgi:Anti-sigma-K factor rskA/Putative zinc-finger
VTTMTDHPQDDLAAYAVDALDGPERAALELHLAGCDECRGELDGHRATLAWVVDDEAPPPSVWDAIAAETGAPTTLSVPEAPSWDEPEAPGTGIPPAADVPPGAGDVVPLTSRPPRHLRGGARGTSRRMLVGALAAAAAVVIAVGVVPQVWDRLSDGDDAPSGEFADLPVGPITAADGTEVAYVRVDDDGSYIEMTDELTDLEQTRTWQLWSLDGPEPVSLGLLGTGADDEVRVAIPEGTTDVAISDEPAGGSPAPTGLIAGQGELAVPA